MNLNDLLNGFYRQALATAGNLKTTSTGVIVGIGYLILRYHHNHVLEAGDIEMAIGIATLGTVAKDGTKTGAPPKDALALKDDI